MKVYCPSGSRKKLRIICVTESCRKSKKNCGNDFIKPSHEVHSLREWSRIKIIPQFFYFSGNSESVSEAVKKEEPRRERFSKMLWVLMLASFCFSSSSSSGGSSSGGGSVPVVSIDIDPTNVTHTISPLVMGCHSDSDFGHQARSLYAQLVVGESFEELPDVHVSADLP